MTQPELFLNDTNPEDFHIAIESSFDTSIDLWLENGNVQFIVADRYGDNIFAIEAPMDEVKISINTETFAFVYGAVFRYRGEIAPSILDDGKKDREAVYLRWEDDSLDNHLYLPRKIAACKKAGLAIYDNPSELGVLL